MHSPRILLASISLNVLLLIAVSYLAGVRSVDHLPPQEEAATSPAKSFSSTAAVSPTQSFASQSAKPQPQDVKAASSHAAPQPLANASAYSPNLPTPSPGVTSSPTTAGAGNSLPAATTSSSPSSGETLSSTEETAGRPVRASAPGNSLRFRGMQVAVMETYGSSGPSAQPSLGVDITPSAANDPSAAGRGDSSTLASDGSSEAGVGGQSNNQASSKFSSSSTPPGLISSSNSNSGSPGITYGFTPEEDLFRTKWGWAAFDAARSAARQEAAAAAKKKK